MKIIKINENQLNYIIKKILNEEEPTASSGKKNLNPNNLKQGDRGEAVSFLQQKLFDSGCLKTKKMTPTGYFGPLTHAALIKYNNSVDGNCRKKTNTSIPTNLQLSDTLSNTYKNEILRNANKISSVQPVPYLIKNPGTDKCAHFVNLLSDKYDKIYDAWLGHNIRKLGERIWTAFHPLPKDKIKPIIDLWQKVYKKGGPEEKGKYNIEIGILAGGLIPNTIPVKLQLDDIVGLYNPSSAHHEEALYYAGKDYFTIDNTKKTAVPKPSLLSGEGFGLNTHVGIVGAIKNGVPIIFHNVVGKVMMDPYNKLSGKMKIAWVRRK